MKKPRKKLPSNMSRIPSEVLIRELGTRYKSLIVVADDYGKIRSTYKGCIVQCLGLAAFESANLSKKILENGK